MSTDIHRLLDEAFAGVEMTPDAQDLKEEIRANLVARVEELECSGRTSSDAARQAIGELLTCSRCIGMWAATGVVGLHTVAPRSGRLLTWSLAAAAANDFLQTGFSALAAKSNELERRAAS